MWCLVKCRKLRWKQGQPLSCTLCVVLLRIRELSHDSPIPSHHLLDNHQVLELPRNWTSLQPKPNLSAPPLARWKNDVEVEGRRSNANHCYPHPWDSCVVGIDTVSLYSHFITSPSKHSLFARANHELVSISAP